MTIPAGPTAPAPFTVPEGPLAPAPVTTPEAITALAGIARPANPTDPCPHPEAWVWEKSASMAKDTAIWNWIFQIGDNYEVVNENKSKIINENVSYQGVHPVGCV